MLQTLFHIGKFRSLVYEADPDHVPPPEKGNNGDASPSGSSMRMQRKDSG